jgi:hypothetical protein
VHGFLKSAVAAHGVLGTALFFGLALLDGTVAL